VKATDALTGATAMPSAPPHAVRSHGAAAAGDASPLPSHVVVAVVGAGAAGLGAAAALQARGVPALVLERDRAVGASWRRRYASVRLNTVGWMSGLPGMRIPRSAGPWPSRDDFVAYLERYAERNDVDVRTAVDVHRIDRDGDGYRLGTSRGVVRARFVVVATGFNHTPVIPDWPGRDGFRGRLVHASGYRDATPFRGLDVLVVGLGNTGSEIAAELVRGGARVRVSMRTPPNILRRSNLGIPATVIGRLGELPPAALHDCFGVVLQRLLWGDLSRFGLPPAPYGIATEIRMKGLGPLVDNGFVGLLKAGRLSLVAALEGFDGADVVLRDGSRLCPDVVIAATGYGFGLAPLVGELGVLLPSGRPALVAEHTHARAPGLYFNGYHAPLRGQLPAMKRTSHRIARAIARQWRADAA
jgi:hypothetical protein